MLYQYVKKCKTNGMSVQADLQRCTDGKQIVFFLQQLRSTGKQARRNLPRHTAPIYLPCDRKILSWSCEHSFQHTWVHSLTNAWDKSHQESERNGSLLGEIHISHLLVQDEKQKHFFQSTQKDAPNWNDFMYTWPVQWSCQMGKYKFWI